MLVFSAIRPFLVFLKESFAWEKNEQNVESNNFRFQDQLCGEGNPMYGVSHISRCTKYLTLMLVREIPPSQRDRKVKFGLKLSTISSNAIMS